MQLNWRSYFETINKQEWNLLLQKIPELRMPAILIFEATVLVALFSQQSLFVR